MFQKFIQFVKYNNATVIIVLAFLIIGTGVLASETGQELLGEESVRLEGVDNTALLEADLEKLDMNFSIEDIREDEKYYYVTYTHLDLDKVNAGGREGGLGQKEKNVWQWQIQERVRKVSKKSNVELDKYLVEEFKEEYQFRIKRLKEEQSKAEEVGEEKVLEISEYSGLIGKTLAIADNIFEEYEAVKVRALPTPINSISLKELKLTGEEGVSDSLTDVYNDYINRNDPDGDDVLNDDDNCPGDYNPSQGDRDDDGVGDVCDTNPDDEEILSLPLQNDSGEDQDDNTATPTPEIFIDDEVATPTPGLVEPEEEIGDPIETSIEVSTEKEIIEEVPEETPTEPGASEESAEPISTETPASEEPDVEIVELEE